jgi:hypothetical protein
MLTCIAALVVLAAVLGKELHVSNYDLERSDFHSYYQAALAVRRGANPLAPVASWISSYRAGQPLIASYFVYTPSFALLIVPFTYLPFATAYALWGFSNLAFLFGSIYSSQRFAARRFTVVSTLVLTTLAALLPPVRFELTWGQADLFVLFMLSAAFWARVERRPVLGGIVLAIVCVTKPQLLLIVAFLLWKREIKFAGSALVAFPLMLLAPFVWLGGTALSDQFAVWQFWSNEYVPFIDNMSLKGVLARLFTTNPSAHPLVIAPILVTLGWIAVVAVVGGLTVAMIVPRPLRRESSSMLELGLMIAAMLLVSPLTEYIYFTLLVFSMVGVYIVLTQVDWRSARYRRMAIGLAVFAAVICLPLQRIEYFFSLRMYTQSALSAFSILLGAPYLFVMVGYFAFQVYALQRATGRNIGDVAQTWKHNCLALGESVGRAAWRARADVVATQGPGRAATAAEGDVRSRPQRL